jgi:6-phosphogluconolactonase/glucosamine-6-phosphate isomerase/deaminase
MNLDLNKKYNNMEIIDNTNSVEGVKNAAQKINYILEQYKKNGAPILFMVSGGSAFELLNFIDENVLHNLSSRLTVGVLDERYSTDPSINNFSQLMQTEFYKKTFKTGANFIDTRVQKKMFFINESIGQMEERLDRELKEWKQNNPGGKIVITQGIGSDGHTSGIMPFPENPKKFNQLFSNPDEWVVGYNAGNKNKYPMRVTTNLTFLRDIVDNSIVFIKKEGKEKALMNLMDNSVHISHTPSKVIFQMKKVSVFVV